MKDVIEWFNNDIREHGYVDTFDEKYKEVNILEVEYSLLTKTNIHNFQPDEIKRYQGIEPRNDY